ncbi:MAG: [FeFe] hydrogenase H-cluster radical SAM maturase HydE [Spirochaetes bacterium]|jgi:biotin synthase|nr:[FeFe] hydrogenase H-cluster radical SAM maturase HydE [Spirochaetota bacterium]
MLLKYESRDEIASLLSEQDPGKIEIIRSAAHEVLVRECGDGVFYRGLIEFSNNCRSDCYYCGIRCSNGDVNRFDLTKDEIVESALWCAENGYGSVVLQSGENSSESFISFVCDTVSTIKKRSVSDRLPDGLGITLCVGEQSEEDYKRFFEAGAHRYLLRIETTNPDLFRSIHPEDQTLEHRIECLKRLRRTGFQVGTGVMFGLPGQNYEMLADDILFFKAMDIDMIGMGPYIPHSATPLITRKRQFKIVGDALLTVSLLMIAACRLVLKDINIAATTALQTIDPQGREKGLSFGANVIMPQLTPVDYRKSYLLYDNKPCLEDTKEDCRNCLSRRIEGVNRVIRYNEWGDSPHFMRRRRI